VAAAIEEDVEAGPFISLTMTEPTRAEVEFHRECVRGAIQLKNEIGYDPTRFSQMVAEHGGREAVRLLLKGRDAYGFTTLWEAGRLEMSVEAMVLLPWYEQLFADDERTKARRRLLDHQFDIDSFIQRRRVSPPPWTAEEQ
jgi:hypothetical protein